MTCTEPARLTHPSKQKGAGSQRKNSWNRTFNKKKSSLLLESRLWSSVLQDTSIIQHLFCKGRVFWYAQFDIKYLFTATIWGLRHRWYAKDVTSSLLRQTWKVKIHILNGKIESILHYLDRGRFLEFNTPTTRLLCLLVAFTFMRRL